MLFTGFSPEAQSFLQSVERNNNRVWFEAHRADYEKLILTPLRKLVMDLSPVMHDIDPELELRPVVNKTISRIYRDTRFSSDKTLLRSNMWINFKRPQKEWHDIPSWWFEITPVQFTYGMGFYQASPATLRQFRDRINSKVSLFREVIAFYPGDPPFRLEGSLYKRRIASGLPEDIQDWYQRKNMYLICRCEPDKLFFSEALVAHLGRRFTELAPLYHYWMESSLLKS
ncbi:MAG: DUF2461 domain-containing protein [Candidatus Marinimicrobia bacterium]|nr:DUF2461 domain-containing protein [Candidatus Neomarinimicrobiota bacterium]